MHVDITDLAQFELTILLGLRSDHNMEACIFTSIWTVVSKNLLAISSPPVTYAPNASDLEWIRKA